MFILPRKALKLLALALCVPALTFAQAAPVAESAPIKIAMVESLSGPFANTGEAVFRNLIWAVERVNARGGVKLAGGHRPLEIDRYDSKGQTEEALSALKSAIDDGAQFIMQGNSSATAAALIDAINKHNEREPGKRVLFLNYSAVDPILTNEKCSFWHFRFDAHADMRMTALMDVLKEDKSLQRVYLIGQDYSFGHAVAREAKRQLAALRPDVQVVGEELHPMGRIKDFLPYAAKIKASGAQAVITGNFGNDLTLLVKAAKEVGFEGKFYTFYGNALGAPAAIGDAGIGKVVAVADWLPNVQTASSEVFYQSFRQRFPKPADDYVHMRMQLMVESLAQAIEKAGTTNSIAVATQLERAKVTLKGQSGAMRASDHQFQQQLLVGLMDRQGAPGVKFDVEGSGYGFRVIKTLTAARAEQPTSCKMQRP
ncbi:MAG: branched-chain amino acid ABC transporter substrate-binding protein [Rhodoferax sp.]|uniref:branched-chain amino acid ABC transporter substrate-binding protein n=1 Tax=Rhodoferax sp. TaxID=50421 RepID=UPI00182DD2E8|nr:branched-chain amino acid ABC transporter substrate-binding protein [Rhodoferax sp.]NMM14990.1 branched-chain amino acid ABC transporter substrate-binding protein [Rhodoferax sp.]NMM21441.1 branched-chain amino acid ABC transporter substrate-binding protein [Rhodoferax sp.]